MSLFENSGCTWRNLQVEMASNKHEKLLTRMRTSKAGFVGKDFEKLYLGFGFKIAPGGRDTKYQHPVHTDLLAFVSRGSGELSKAYAEDAVKLIDSLKRRQEGTKNA